MKTTLKVAEPVIEQKAEVAKSNNWKRAMWIPAMIILFFVGDRLAGMVLKNVTEKSQFRYTRLYNGTASADILLIGNSRGLSFYEPYIEEVTGKTTFNMSYNGMPVDLANVLLQDYLDKNEKPEIILFDVTMADRENKTMTNGFSCYSPYSERLSTLIKSNDTTGYYATQLTHLYRYNSEIFQRALFFTNKSDRGMLIDREINQNTVAEAANLEDYNICDTLYSLQQNITEMVDLAAKNGIRMELVINPYYVPFAESIQNMNQPSEYYEVDKEIFSFEEFEQKVNDGKLDKDVKKKRIKFVGFVPQIEKIAKGKKVHDYSKAISEEKAFGDYQHLNKYGAQLYVDQLVKDGLLPEKLK